MNKKQKKNLIRVIITLVLFIILFFLSKFNLIENQILKLSLYMIPYLIIGYDILLKAFRGIKNLRPFDENFLMAIATIGAIALGDYSEGVAVMLFYQIGELFQSYAVGKSRKNISELMDIRPDYANIFDEDGNIKKVNPSEVNVGDTIVINPGEKIPLDGMVTEGVTTLNTSSLTGESIPREVKENDEVNSGCINISGVIKVRVTKNFSESTASKILELVSNASSKKSKSENFITKFARIYTPCVVFCALGIFIIPIIFNLIVSNDLNINVWLYRALTFLVISCPCALVISIPLSFFAGLGGASKCGILIKGSNYLETLSKIKIVVFDKTGTMTKGVFEVEELHHASLSKDDLLFYAAHCEMHSNHPIAKSLKNAYEKELIEKYVSDVKEIAGRGISAEVYRKKVLLGNEKLMKENNIEYIECHDTGTIVHIAIDGEYQGHFVVNDVIKPNSIQAIAELKKIGIKKTVMLTGDKESVANEIADKIGIDETYSELLPLDKVTKIENIINHKEEKEKVAFVGDGINDAPVLSRADIGISMGALGSDAAIEASDVVLMDDNPLKISKAIRISKKCIGIVYQNIYFALFIKLGCLILGAFGIVNMWAAIFADVGVMIIAVLNAIRALNVKNI